MKSEPQLPQKSSGQHLSGFHASLEAFSVKVEPAPGTQFPNRNLHGAPGPARPAAQSRSKTTSAQTETHIRGRAASRGPALIPPAAKPAPCATSRAQSSKIG